MAPPRPAAPWLARAELLDCRGQVSHTLTLRVDGLVAIRFAAGHEAVVDPEHRRSLTPGIHLDDGLLDAAGALRPR